MTARTVMRLTRRGWRPRGTVRFAGEDVLAMGSRRLRAMRGAEIGMIYQDPRAHTNPVRTNGDSLLEGMVSQGVPRQEARERALELLASVGIDDGERRMAQFPHQLSGGLLQRIMIAAAMSMRPQLLLADEPTTALDVTTQQEVMAILGEQRAERGLSLVVITHDLDLAAAVTDRIAVMYAGALLNSPVPQPAPRGAPPLHRSAHDLEARARRASPDPDNSGTPGLSVRGRSGLRVRGPVPVRGGPLSQRATGSAPGRWPRDRLPSGRGHRRRARRPARLRMTATDLALEVENLRKLFRVPGSGRGDEELVAVDDVSFTVARGGSLAVVGESGSGKTTVARMIVGLETPTAGRIVVGGRDWAGASGAKARRERARAAQMVFQDPYSSLDPRQTVFDCLDEVLRLHTPLPNDGRNARVRELLDQVGLDERHEPLRPQALSGGQRQRVAIARALAAEPQVLILDEAVSALDVSVQGQVLNLLADLRSQLGITSVFVSHDLAVVQQVSDDIVVMRRGEVVERGTTDDVLAAPQHEYTQELMDAVPREGWKPRRSAQRLGRPVSRLVGMPDRPSPRRETPADTAAEESARD